MFGCRKCAEHYMGSLNGDGITGDRGLLEELVSDDLARRIYGRGGGFFWSGGGLTGEMGELPDIPAISSNPSCNMRGGGRSTIASNS